MEQYASDFTPEAFEDEYQVELRKLIDAKLEAGDTLDTAATFGETVGEDKDGSGDGDGEDADVIDLMEALKASLDRKRGKSEKSSEKTEVGASSGTKKPAAKKSGTSAKKPTTKKSA